MEDKTKIKFKYVFAPDYNPTYTNGAFGGVTPRGEIILNFYLERHGLPEAQIHEIEKGKLSEEYELEPKDQASNMVRYVNSGIILSYESAKAIHFWLGKQIKKFESNVSSNNDSPEGKEE